MELAEAALQNLAHVARLDGEFSSTERALLKSYGDALGLSRSAVERVCRMRRPALASPSEWSGSDDERRHVLKMMVRVACSDGYLSRKERRLLRVVAHSIGIGRFAFVDLVVDVKRHAGLRHGLRMWQFMTVAGGLLAAFLGWLWISNVDTSAGDARDEVRRSVARLDQLRIEIDAAETERAAAAERAVRDAQLAQQRMAQELARRISDLEKTLGVPGADGSSEPVGAADVRVEIARLRNELERVRSTTAVFQALERRFQSSVLYVHSSYTLTFHGRTISRSNVGTAFWVTANGYLVTNKHVVKNWLFNPEDVKRITGGWELLPSSVQYAVWPSGREVLTPDRKLDLAVGYSTTKDTLRIHSTAPDQFEMRTRKLPSGESVRGLFHQLDINDLAVLKAEIEAPVVPLPLVPDDHRIEKLDPVMALGFPASITARERGRLETAPSLGEVRKVGSTIFISAPIVGGNSGGPLFGTDGYVLGVCYATYGASTVGACIPVKHVLPLLPKVERDELRRR